MCGNRVIFENIVLIFDHNYYVLSRRDSLIVNCQLLIVNYKHQFVDSLRSADAIVRCCLNPKIPARFCRGAGRSLPEEPGRERFFLGRGIEGDLLRNVFPRGDTGYFFEYRVEIALRGEGKLIGDLSQGEVRAAHQALGFVDLLDGNIVGQANTRFLFESSA